MFYPRPDPGSLGILILEGLLLVRIDAGERGHIELLSEGDVISPWNGSGSGLALPPVTTTRVVSDVRMALLSRGFVRRTAQWPEIQAALVQRLILRARRLGLQSAINGLTRIEERLELTLWQMALRFGNVTRDGYALWLGLTHAQLAEVVGAQRPSVSTALARLERAQRLVRGPDRWLLPGPPPARLDALSHQTGLEGAHPASRATAAGTNLIAQVSSRL